MINPYRPSTLDGTAPNRLPTASPQLIVVLYFGLFPAAIIIARVMNEIADSMRGWGLFYWVFSVLPPLYFAGAWLFAIRCERRGATVQCRWLPVALLPLVLFLIFVWCVTIVGLWQSGRYVLTGWIAVDHLLWLAASIPVTFYFISSIRSEHHSHRQKRQAASEPFTHVRTGRV